MISLTHRQQLQLFFELVEKKYGPDALRFCRQWLEANRPDAFNEEGLIWEWRCHSQQDDLAAFSEAAEICTNSRMEIAGQ